MDGGDKDALEPPVEAVRAPLAASPPRHVELRAPQRIELWRSPSEAGSST